MISPTRSRKEGHSGLSRDDGSGLTSLHAELETKGHGVVWRGGFSSAPPREVCLISFQDVRLSLRGAGFPGTLPEPSSYG